MVAWRPFPLGNWTSDHSSRQVLETERDISHKGPYRRWSGQGSRLTRSGQVRSSVVVYWEHGIIVVWVGRYWWYLSRVATDLPRKGTYTTASLPKKI